jgi:uncharacterized membrane protein (UPF0127 family)
MAWLLRCGEVLASVDVAGDRASAGASGAVTLARSHVVHSFGSQRAFDVAYLDDRLVVLAIRHLAARRLGVRPRRAELVLRAESGAFERWSLRPGDQLELKQ